MIYPWQQSDWQQLCANWQQMPHAWLIYGKKNIGKSEFARHLAQALLCETPLGAGIACGECPSCHLFHSEDGHPDFYVLTPDLASDGESRKLAQIKIDAVRQILEPLHQSALRGGRRVVLIEPAESLNTQAANALLKILEEPPENVVFILLSHNRDRLLPTIKSRCRQLLLRAPDYAQSLNYLREKQMPNAENLLAFHSGTPLFTPDEAQDKSREQLLILLAKPRLLAILDFAQQFDKQKYALAIFLDSVQKWLFDIALAYQQIVPNYYPQYETELRQIADKTQERNIFQLQETLNKLVPYGYHSLNMRLQVENILIAYLKFVQNLS